jgi:very-short-patch-repair endonuclease
MERSLEEWLNKQGLHRGYNGYLTEVHFYNPNTKKNGFADFVLAKYKLIIELDGTHHIKRKKLDDVRDAYLKSRGWNVYRIPIAEYKTGKHIPILLKMVCSEGIEPFDFLPSV